MIVKFLVIILCICMIRFCFCNSDYDVQLVNAYQDLILNETAKLRNYEMPTDNSKHKARNSRPVDFGEYDFIVIGAGSTGAVVASRLSEITAWKILVIEAGDYGNNFTEITRMSYDSYIMSDYNWGYYSVPQKHSCLGMAGGKCAHARGKGIGGTSLLNALIYNRGNEKDFDIWCGLGNPGWCYKDVLAYFLKSEDFPHNQPEWPYDEGYHRIGGLLRVEYPNPITEQTKIFLQANRDLGYNDTDMSGRSQIGATPFQINVKNGKRQDSGTAFLMPFIRRKNLKISVNSLATKILFNKHKKATAVLFTHDGILYKARVKREVISCAGAINGPQLLMLSGIGPKDHLKEHGIPVISDLQVGSSFSDHLQVYGLSFRSNLSEYEKPLRENIKDYLKGKGFLAEALSSQGVGYYVTDLEPIEGYPDLEISFSDSNSSTYALSTYQKWDCSISQTMGIRNQPSDFGVFVTILHTVSEGTVRLQSDSPYDFPIIDPNCMSDPEGKDIRLVYEGIQFALRLADTPAFKSINATLAMKPMKACEHLEFKSREYWYCVIKFITAHNNHPVATSKMGPDPKKGFVVDHNLKVHGVKNLRIADASVIPISTSSHINAICYMIGEKLGDILKRQYRYR